MCGRFSLTATPEEVQELFGLMEVDDFPPRYNIAPTQPVLLVIAAPSQPEPGSNRPSRVAILARWGLIPSWAKDPKDLPLLINARSETAAEKNAFRAAMRHRRALIPASGFYEWRRDKASKTSQPFWIRPVGGGLVAFGALMETYADPSGGEIDTVAVLTTRANTAIAGIHDRMPVMIRPGDFARWLDCRGNEPRDVADLLQPVEDGYFEAIAVSTKVNKVANTGADVQEPARPADGPRGRMAGRKVAGGGQMDLF